MIATWVVQPPADDNHGFEVAADETKAAAEGAESSIDDAFVEHIRGTNMRLIEPGERNDFLAILQQNGFAEGEFDLRETDTTDPKSDENCGLQGYVGVTRLATQVTKEYPLCDESDWLQHFRRDLEAGVFA